MINQGGKSTVQIIGYGPDKADKSFVDTELEKLSSSVAQSATHAKSIEMSALNGIKPLYINTFDGSHEPYHPTVKYFPSTWNGFYYWMAYTPYPVSATPYIDRWECPSIAVSNDGKTWVKPAVVNPLIDLTASEITRGDYFSDPSIVMNGSTMEIWYRKTNGANTDQTDIYRITSTNGTTWTAPELVVDSLSTGNGLVGKIMRSQQMFLSNGVYRSYWCEGPFGGQRKLVFAESSNPSGGVWSNYTECILKNPPLNFNPWHVGMSLVSGVYYATIYDNSRLTVDYFKSSDGVNFDFMATILSPTASILNWYQTYPLRVGNKWYIYAGGTFDNKHGIMLFQSDDLINLQGVDGGDHIRKMLVRGSVALDNKETTTNTEQKIFATLEKESASNKYGYGMDIPKKYPLWFQGSNMQPISTFLYANKNTQLPTQMGQFIKDSVTGGVFVSIDTTGTGTFAWRPINTQVPIDRTAASTISTGGYLLIKLSATGATTITTITGGSDYERIILINTSNFDITLTHSVSDNTIMTQDKLNYTLKSGSSVQLLAIPVSTGVVRWNVI